MVNANNSLLLAAKSLGFCALLIAQAVALGPDSGSAPINPPPSATVSDSNASVLVDTIKKADSAVAVSESLSTTPGSSNPLPPKTAVAPSPTPAKVEEEDILLKGGSSPDYRSPRKAMFLSLIVPGLGQFYARSKFKAVAFLAVEAGLFGARERFNNQGDAKDREFREFVDENFSDSSYKAWWSEIVSAIEAGSSGLDTSLLGNHNSYLDEQSIGSQQYYEVVYKYPQFVQGWKDVTPTLQQFKDNDIPDSAGTSPAVLVPPFRIEVDHPALGKDTIFGYSALQLEAAEKSAKANGAYRNADNVWFAILANHLCSAIDAALTARRYNRANLGQGQAFLDRLHIESRTLAGKSGFVPVVTARIDF